MDYTLNLPTRAYDPGLNRYFRSSTFLPGKTAPNTNKYLTDYPDHDTVRVTNIGYDLRTSKDFVTFRDKLIKQKAYLEFLATKHQRIIIGIMGMPKWLSSSQDETLVLGDYKQFMGMPPKSFDDWKTIMDVIGAYLGSMNWGNAEVYIEFWNEPDLEFWQSDIANFLALYAYTAAAFANFKFGGAGLNWWHKPLKGSNNPLNVDLISFCAAYNVKLDFISWHIFSSDVRHLEWAYQVFYQKAVEQELQLEYLVTEWNGNSAARNNIYAPYVYADLQDKLAEMRLVHTFSAWEDFSANDLNDYGLIRHSGEVKNVFWAHEFFESLSRGQGIFKIKPRMLATRKSAKEFEIVLWGYGGPVGFVLHETPKTATLEVAAEPVVTIKPTTIKRKRVNFTLGQFDLARVKLTF